MNNGSASCIKAVHYYKREKASIFKYVCHKKERLSNCSRLKENKDTWQLNATRSCTDGTKML